ncbi:hypothetical protein [Olleya sp. YS]|uniref:hypothetical protein n=1 Tax=Olleya sp. YS TaxID=3028318 RepID=UPI0024344A60|nr:hypothetical protein [Olleya sp. YS]WGD34397.1 hypothetical protein Ollyesu_11480 [Olleya sp. YS]
MGLDIIIFIGAILFGIFVYWTESKSNGLYRFFNKLFNSKDLQMKPTDKKGFIFKQEFLPRLVYLAVAFLVIGLIIQFLTPIEIFSNYYGVSAFASAIFGTLIGTYIANFVLKSGEVIEEQSDSIEDVVKEGINKGKEFIEDLKNKDSKVVQEAKKEIKEESKAPEKSARERLKDKGLM